jgi:hypothetical protein
MPAWRMHLLARSLHSRSIYLYQSSQVMTKITHYNFERRMTLICVCFGIPM